MQGCDKTVTILHIAYDGQTDRDVETDRTFEGCSWYGQTGASADSSGLRGASLYKCRIPQSVLGEIEPEIQIGDKVRCSGVEATITAVHDNRGRPAPHIYLEAR